MRVRSALLRPSVIVVGLVCSLIIKPSLADEMVDKKGDRLLEQESKSAYEQELVRFRNSTVVSEEDRQKAMEMKQMHVKEQLANITGNQVEKPTFIIFMSSSMNKNNIKELFAAGKQYKGTLVMRGFVEGKFPKTAEYLQQFFTEEDKETGIVIDPTLFDEYRITVVPTFVLAKGDKFDKVVGNITAEAALKYFEAEGDLASDATALLDSVNAEGKR